VDSTAGLEELWIIAVPANPNGPRADPKIFATPSQSRALLASDAVRWLDAVLDDEMGYGA